MSAEDQTSNPLIIVADDDVSSVRILEMGLRRAGYQIFVVANGQQVLELVQSHRPNLIVMDDFLPLLAGNEVCRRLKQNPETAHIPVILVSAGERVRDKALMQEVGVDYAMNKPFNLSELLQVVKDLLG